MRKGKDLVPQIPDDTQDVFSARIRYVMMCDKIKGRELAKKLDIDQSYLSFYLTGRRRPSIDKAVAIAKALDVSLDWLCGLED